MTDQQEGQVPAHDPESVMNRALDSERGIRVQFPDTPAAERFRNRCYKIKRREAERSKKELGLAESEWDILTFRTAGLPEGVLEIVPGSPDILAIEDL